MDVALRFKKAIEDLKANQGDPEKEDEILKNLKKDCYFNLEKLSNNNN